MLATVRWLLIVLGMLAAAPVYAAGFGWYAILFDYETFEADFDAELDRTLTIAHADLYGERVRGARPTDGAVFEYIDSNAERYGVEYPQTFELELMWDRAAVTWTRSDVRPFRA